MSSYLAQFRGELVKLFARKRTYIGFGAFLAIELLLLGLLRLERVQRSVTRMIEASGYDASEYLSGLTLGLMILLWTVLLLGSLYLALVAGDLVSKEVEDGTMRMILCRPVSRLSLLSQKALAALVYTAALVGFISGTALLAGLIERGGGGLFVFAPFERVFALYDFGEGLKRYALAQPFLVLSLFTITSIGFFFSCLNMKPAAATILTLSFLLIDSILKTIPYFETIREWFLTAHMASWVQVFQPRIPWDVMLESYVMLLAIDATLLVMGWLAFERRDFKS
ncbi:MAG: ABC transporter permease [Chthoniobacterales bacterium]